MQISTYDSHIGGHLEFFKFTFYRLLAIENIVGFLGKEQVFTCILETHVIKRNHSDTQHYALKGMQMQLRIYTVHLGHVAFASVERHISLRAHEVETISTRYISNVFTDTY